ncbi:GntR domain-containing protein [Burkholderia sp. YI23]|nr:GntR domain-containing protein [Burkholderia sp. YI23]
MDTADSSENSQAEAVVNGLQAMILSGTLKPGAKLREAELGELFNVSRTPVREALVALETRGMVVYERNRGFSVRSFSLRDLRDSYELRAVLEGYASALAAQRGFSDEQVEAMRAYLSETGRMLVGERTLDQEEVQAMRERSDWFHAQINDAWTNALFRRSHEMVHRTPHKPFTEPLMDTASMRRYHEEHVRIFEAVASRDSSRAEHLMREHILRGCFEIDLRLKIEHHH